jgi:hypothetical protein
VKAPPTGESGSPEAKRDRALSGRRIGDVAGKRLGSTARAPLAESFVVNSSVLFDRRERVAHDEARSLECRRPGRERQAMHRRDDQLGEGVEPMQVRVTSGERPCQRLGIERLGHRPIAPDEDAARRESSRTGRARGKDEGRVRAAKRRRELESGAYEAFR